MTARWPRQRTVPDTGGQNPASTHGAAPNERFRACVLPELPLLLRVGERVTGNPGDAEDLVQETLVRAYRAIDRFDGSPPRAWLLTILRRTWLDMARQQQPQLFEDPRDLLGLPAADPEGLPGAKDVVGGMLDGELEAVLRSLSVRHRQVVVLVDVDGLGYQEVADVLGLPVGAVMSRLQRARRKLHRRLAASRQRG